MGSIQLFSHETDVATLLEQEVLPQGWHTARIEADAEATETPLTSLPAPRLAQIRELAFQVWCVPADPDHDASAAPVRLEFTLHHRGTAYPLDYSAVPGGCDFTTGPDDERARSTASDAIGMLVRGFLVRSYTVPLAGAQSIVVEPGEILTLTARRPLPQTNAATTMERSHYTGALAFTLDCLGLEAVQITPRRVRRRRKNLLDGAATSAVCEPANERGSHV